MFEPGHGQSYSNTNYAVLGMLVERVTGRPLASVLDREVFGPLGMRSASLRRDRVDEAPVAHGYAFGADATGWDLTWGWAAGGLVSDAPDVDRFFHALFAGRLLDRRLVDEMARPRAGWLGQWSGYGLGLARLPTRCGPVRRAHRRRGRLRVGGVHPPGRGRLGRADGDHRPGPPGRAAARRAGDRAVRGLRPRRWRIRQSQQGYWAVGFGA